MLICVMKGESLGSIIPFLFMVLKDLAHVISTVLLLIGIKMLTETVGS